MSEPMTPPPPSPPAAPPPPPAAPPPAGFHPARDVQGPAIGLLLVGGLGAAFSLLFILQRMLGMAFLSPRSFGGASDYADYVFGAGFVFWIFVLVLSGFVLWGGWQMKSMRQWTLAVAASVVTMLPCLGPCCGLGLPIGVWALVVLLKPEVKNAFTA
jgi:hypothetical protein